MSTKQVHSRFNHLDKPVAYPGCCLVCGNVSGPVADFGATIDLVYGACAIYLCYTCITQVAVEIGMANRETVERLQGTITKLDEDVANATKKVVKRVFDLLGSIDTYVDSHISADPDFNFNIEDAAKELTAKSELFAGIRDPK